VELQEEAKNSADIDFSEKKQTEEGGEGAKEDASPALETAGAGTVKLTLHKAKDLKDVESFGKQDPYVKLNFGEEKAKSKVHQDGGKNPSWEQNFSLSIAESDAVLHLEVWDDNTFKDSFIGQVDIPRASLLRQKAAVWYTVFNKGKKSDEKRGQVLLAAEFFPGQTEEAQDDDADAPEAAAPAEGEAAAGKTFKFTIHKAKKLPVVDKMGAQDPYVRCKALSQEHTTAVKTDAGTEPVWEESFTLEQMTETTAILVDIWDKENIGKDK